MAQKDWLEILNSFNAANSGYLRDFTKSADSFLPNAASPSPFNGGTENFSAAELSKPKPGNWIPVYKKEDLPPIMHEIDITPIRAGQAEFFFYRGAIFFDLTGLEFDPVDTSSVPPIADFIPLTLRAKFQRNENAYLNKAMALGFIHHFLDQSSLHILKRTVNNPSGKRLLYGQFGKIKTTKDLLFETSKGSKTVKAGFQFEIDLVLESKEEIIIFEAKTGARPVKSFSLLQLYYPLIYFKTFLHEHKPIRTVFIDITTDQEKEIYRMVELVFEEGKFDWLGISQAKEYINFI